MSSEVVSKVGVTEIDLSGWGGVSFQLGSMVKDLSLTISVAVQNNAAGSTYRMEM